MGLDSPAKIRYESAFQTL